MSRAMKLALGLALVAEAGVVFTYLTRDWFGFGCFAVAYLSSLAIVTDRVQRGAK